MSDDMVTGNVCRFIIPLLVAVLVLYTFLSGKKYTSFRYGPESIIEQSNSGTNTTMHRDRLIILVVGYMRSGSSLTAAIFQEHPGTFYAFEPIRNISVTFKRLKNGRKLTLKYFDGKERSFRASDKLNAVFDEINDWFSCKLESLSKGTLTDKSHEIQTKIMKSFSQCINKQLPNTSVIDSCFKIATNLCQKAPFLLFKFIRLKMKDVIKLMPIYPNMKVLHLVRDPRGILHSRLNVIRFVKLSNYKTHIQSHCSLLEENLKHSKLILEKYANRLKIVRYEDIANRATGTARELFQFAGLPFNKPLQDFIRYQTSAPRSSSKWGIQRKNSSQTASKWRTLLDPQLASYTYAACNTSNKILGYLPLKSVQEMRDERVPSIEKDIDINKQLHKQLSLYVNIK